MSRFSFPIAFLLLFLAVSSGQAKEENPSPTVSIEFLVPDVLQGTADIRVPQIKPLENGEEPVSYPTDALEEGIAGSVELSMHIGVGGKVLEYYAISTNSDSRLINAAINGLSKAEFVPATIDGIPSDLWATIIVKFQLPEGFVSVRIPPTVDKEGLRSKISYPEQARTAGITGSVPVEAEITKKGEALNVTIPDSANALLAEAVRKGVKEMRFIPAKRHDSAMDGRIEFTVDFLMGIGGPGTEGNGWVVIKNKENPFGITEAVSGATPPRYDEARLNSLVRIPEEVKNNCFNGSIISFNNRAQISLEIDRNGKIIQIVDRSPQGSCVAEPIIAALRQITFTPGTRNGTPATMWLTISQTVE